MLYYFSENNLIRWIMAPNFHIYLSILLRNLSYTKETGAGEFLRPTNTTIKNHWQRQWTIPTRDNNQPTRPDRLMLACICNMSCRSSCVVSSFRGKLCFLVPVIFFPKINYPKISSSNFGITNLTFYGKGVGSIM